jgi:hypothetical protein
LGETEEWDLHPVDTFPIILYKLNDEEERFDKIEVNSIEEIHPYLIFSNIVLVIDTKGHNAYLWEGNEVSVHMRFLSARLAPSVRDRHGSMSTMHLHNIEQSEQSEISAEFKTLMQLS